MPLQQGDPPWLGRYQLTARLGAGGMGVVYLGHADDGQQVAVKVLRPEYADDAEFRARFRREVAAMVRVQNRYTVRVLDADTDSRTPFIVTQYAEGPSLDEHVKAYGPLPPEAVVRLASALAEALAAIHAAGVTHRDLKPSNVLLTNSGPMVIDFGIAQTADGVSITRTGMAIGSPGYMAPEQITGHAGQEADIFTWALIVAFAASGQPPFGGGQAAAIMHRILNGSPDISAVPPQLQRLVQGAIAKDPARRPTAVDMVRELAPGALGGIAPRTAVDPGMTPQTAVDRQAGPTVLDNEYGNQGRTRTMAAEPGPWDAGPWDGGPRDPGPWDEGPPDPDSWDSRPPRRWRGPALAAAALVVLVVIGAMLLSNGGSQKGPSGGGNPGPAATSSARSGTGQVSNQGTQTQPVTVPKAPGHAKKHKHAKAGTGSSGNGTGGAGTGGVGGVATSGPSVSPPASPSSSPLLPLPSSSPTVGG